MPPGLTRTTGALAIVGVSVATAVLLMAAQVSGRAQIGTLVAVAATTFLAGRGSVGDRRGLLVAAFVIVSCQMVLFMTSAAGSDPLASLRLLQVVTVVGYATTALLLLLRALGWSSPRVVLLVVSIAAALLIGETALPLIAPPAARRARVEWKWSTPVQRDPVLGEINPPHTELRTYYPDNPRQYFEPEESGQRIFTDLFTLQVLEGSQASLEFPPGDPQVARVAITRAAPDANWNVQLNVPRLSVEADTNYTVTFRARADRPRFIWVGFGRAHSTGESLGLYERVDLTGQWQSFEKTFTASDAERNARVLFDLANNDAPVEFTGIALRRTADGHPVEPPASWRYMVRYSFNALGCRDREYAIPRPEGAFRILALGDSFTMGVGVHEADTFASRLERLLNQEAPPAESTGSMEVVNCGVSGWATREERLFYELHGHRYAPQLVILTMVWNDDLSWIEEQRRGYAKDQEGRAEKAFRLWAKIQEYRRSRRPYDYTASIDELRRLDTLLRDRNARLAVVMFQMSAGREWDALNAAVSEGLRGTDIPVLTLAPAMMRQPYEQLIVHEIDEHPNEKAHEIAAGEIHGFLRVTGLLRSP